jgi:hypothetical protein
MRRVRFSGRLTGEDHNRPLKRTLLDLEKLVLLLLRARGGCGGLRAGGGGGSALGGRSSAFGARGGSTGGGSSATGGRRSSAFRSFGFLSLGDLHLPVADFRQIENRLRVVPLLFIGETIKPLGSGENIAMANQRTGTFQAAIQ